MARQQFYVKFIATLAFLLVVSLSLAQQQQASGFSLGPLVRTGESNLSPTGRHVAVNVPLFYRLNMDTRGNHSGLRMDQSVLSGLVRVNMDRQRGADGRLQGPLKVTVGGLTMYDNGQTSSSS